MRRNLAAWLSSKAMFNRKLVPTNRCRTWVSLESPTELRISEWISLANECNIFVTLGLDCNRVDRSQNGTCNAELSSIKPESRESIQSKITEPACAEFSATQVGNSAKMGNWKWEIENGKLSTFFKFIFIMQNKNFSAAIIDIHAFF